MLSFNKYEEFDGTQYSVLFIRFRNEWIKEIERHIATFKENLFKRYN